MAHLNEPTEENIAYMIDAIKAKLRMASAAAMQPSHFSVNQYEDIKELYEIVIEKQNISISEVEGIVAELGRLRNK
ncbi:hypothetical protein PA598K_06923 [Paenibacillus sp. 598K]|uniref:DUF1128 domain-containing protein n=1 Tax=Paenibacillus sp. 598K TaxID=1117987 RepID=UPI000FFAE895|nr:DUF1128 domain-containing protein [Paenibacillus sp. 598K]GBF78297.1 hypothetical protein PA598K_06923 [Paenibacillus sp. 598K]